MWGGMYVHIRVKQTPSEQNSEQTVDFMYFGEFKNTGKAKLEELQKRWKQFADPTDLYHWVPHGYGELRAAEWWYVRMRRRTCVHARTRARAFTHARKRTRAFTRAYARATRPPNH